MGLEKIADTPEHWVYGKPLKCNPGVLIGGVFVGIYVMAQSLLVSTFIQMKKDQNKQEVVNYFDKNHDGRLNYEEKSNLYKFMKIKSPYEPTSKDWKRAYRKIKKK